MAGSCENIFNTRFIDNYLLFKRPQKLLVTSSKVTIEIFTNIIRTFLNLLLREGIMVFYSGSCDSLYILDKHFHDRTINSIINFQNDFTDLKWIWFSCSWDLSDFHLWGYLKDHVYQNNLRIIVDLKTNIQTVVERISEGFRNFQWWAVIVDV